MARYEKYLEIIKNVDDALERNKKLLEGKVTPENLKMVEKLLCIEEKAWKCAWIVDRIDDISEGTRKLSEKGNGPDPSTMNNLSKGGDSRGKDFRGGREDSESQTWAYGGNPTSFRASSRGSHEMTHGLEDESDMYSMHDYDQEENRRGVPGTGRYSRLRRGGRYYRSEMNQDEWGEPEESRRGRSRRTGRFVHRDGMDMNGHSPETDFVMLPGMGIPTYFGNGILGRMGYMADPSENNRMYNGVQLPIQNNGMYRPYGNGMTTGGVQVPVQNNGNTNNTGNGSNGGGNSGTMNNQNSTSAIPIHNTPAATSTAI